MDEQTILFYAQKGARERLNDAAAMQRSGLTPDWLDRAIADAREIVSACTAAGVPIEPAIIRALRRVGGEL